MYTVRHFDPHEFLPGLSGQETWATLDPVLRAKLDDRMLEMEDEYRDLVDEPAYVNTYATGGQYSASGFRGPECKVGAPRSMHRQGKAADNHHDSIDRARARAVAAAKAKKLSADKVQAAGQAAAIAQADVLRAKVRAAIAEGKLRFIGGMELGVSWVHLDVRARVGGKVVEFNA